MHAAVVTARIDPDAQEAARAALENEVIPMVKNAPGFIAGYWLEPRDGRGFSIVLFDSEEHARQTAPPVGSNPAPGVTIEELDIRGVAASA